MVRWEYWQWRSTTTDQKCLTAMLTLMVHFPPKTRIFLTRYLHQSGEKTVSSLDSKMIPWKYQIGQYLRSHRRELNILNYACAQVNEGRIENERKQCYTTMDQSHFVTLEKLICKWQSLSCIKRIKDCSPSNYKTCPKNNKAFTMNKNHYQQIKDTYTD